MYVYSLLVSYFSAFLVGESDRLVCRRGALCGMLWALALLQLVGARGGVVVRGGFFLGRCGAHRTERRGRVGSLDICDCRAHR